MAITGGCLCGGVHYEITGPLFAASHCHCSMCRQQHGAAFATYAKFDAGDFKWISGEDLVKVYQTSSGAGWCFCSECGSSLAAADKGRVTSVTLGTIDSDPGIAVESHIFTGSMAPWHEITDNLPQFEEWPADAWETQGKAHGKSVQPD